jgi:hypothetical protein
MKMHVNLKLGGKLIDQSMQRQWERFIKHYPKEIDFNNVSNSLDALYGSFVKQIAEVERDNRGSFQKLLQNHKDEALMGFRFKSFLENDQVKAAFMVLGTDTVQDIKPNSGNLNTLPTNNPSPIPTPPPALRLDEAQIVVELTKPNLDQQSPKAVLAADKFLEVDEDEVMTRDDIERLFEEKMEKIQSDFANMPQQQSKMMEAAEVAQEILMNKVAAEQQPNNPSSIVTPPPAPALSENQIVAELTDPNLKPESPKAVLAASKFLDIAMDEQLSRIDIQNAYEREMADIQKNFANQPQKQEKLADATEIAKAILEKEVRKKGSSWSPATNPNWTEQPKNPVSDAFHQRVQNDGMIIAQSLLNDNIFVVTDKNIMTALQKANIMIWGLTENPAKMAYLIGYVQDTILQLQKSSSKNVPGSKNVSGDAVRAISRIAETLRALNMQQARRA